MSVYRNGEDKARFGKPKGKMAKSGLHGTWIFVLCSGLVSAVF